jgi:hypothetical protein
MMKDWAEKKSNSMRAVEELDIPVEKMQEAMDELDEIIRAWADKYHQDGGKPMILQMVFGNQDS